MDASSRRRRTRALSIRPASDHRNVHVASPLKTQRLVERNRRDIALPCMQESGFAAYSDGRGDMPGQAPGKPMTAEIGMRAYATDFGAARKTKPFTGHRRKSTVDANAEEAAHAMGVAQERARFGQRGQRQHFGRVRL